MSDLHKKISNCLPDCMMPDGAPPCSGYMELLRAAEEMEAKLERLRFLTAIFIHTEGCDCCETGDHEEVRELICQLFDYPQDPESAYSVNGFVVRSIAQNQKEFNV